MDKHVKDAIIAECHKECRANPKFLGERLWVPYLYEKAQLSGLADNDPTRLHDVDIWILKIDEEIAELFPELRVGNLWKVTEDYTIDKITAEMESHGDGQKLEFRDSTG